MNTSPEKQQCDCGSPDAYWENGFTTGSRNYACAKCHKETKLAEMKEHLRNSRNECPLGLSWDKIEKMQGGKLKR